MVSVGLAVLLAAILLAIAGTFHALGRRDLVLIPAAIFVIIDVAATLPPLLPTADSELVREDGFAVLLAATALLAFSFAYFLCGGTSAQQRRWRDERAAPSMAACRSLNAGIILLTAVLVAIAVWRFGGLPPMLKGGLSSLLDPVGHADQVNTLRDGRKLLTKGTLVGENYAGQGLLNAFTQTGWQVAFISAVLAWSWKRTRFNLVLLMAVGALAFLFLGSGGQRGPMIFTALAGLVALTLRFRAKPRGIAVGLVAVLGLLLLIMPLSKGEAAGIGLTDRIDAAWTRVTDGNGRHNAEIINLVESGQLELGYGAIFAQKAIAILPGAAPEPLALRLTRLAYGSKASDTAYSTPTQFGTLYADGGPIAVGLGYVLSGAVIAMMWGFACRIRSYLGAILMAESAMVLGMISITGIAGALAAGVVMVIAVGIVALPGFMSSKRIPRTVASSGIRAADAGTS